MRIYADCHEMVREVERDLWEMGLDIPIQTMQDVKVDGDPDRGMTKELRAYGFTITSPLARLDEMVEYIFPKSSVLEYCDLEIQDRVSGQIMNPGNSHKVRDQVWSEFLHNGTFSYTYSQRITPQLRKIIDELKARPGTRQAVINIHSNFFESFDPNNPDLPHQDLHRIGGVARIPCSMYYQFLIRNGSLDGIYTMRSCDFLTHAPVDWWLAIKLMDHIAREVGVPLGYFHYFTGSLHAYRREMKARGIF